VHPPDVSERLPAAVAACEWRGVVLPRASRRDVRLVGADGPDHQGVRRLDPPVLPHHDVPLVQFAKGQRKDDLAHERLAGFDAEEAVLFVGRAQERTPLFRTEKRAAAPWSSGSRRLRRLRHDERVTEVRTTQSPLRKGRGDLVQDGEQFPHDRRVPPLRRQDCADPAHRAVGRYGPDDELRV
jgi:hypothetical protein